MIVKSVNNETNDAPCCSTGCCTAAVSICFSIRSALVSPEPIVPKEQRDPRAPIDTRELFQARGAMAQNILNILELVRHVYHPLIAKIPYGDFLSDSGK